MHIDPPASTMRLAKMPDPKVHGLHYLFAQRREGIRFHIEHQDARLAEEEYEKVALWFNEVSGVSLPVVFVKNLLGFYPQIRIKLAVLGLDDTEVRDGLTDTLSHFLLGCSWPTYGDGVDLEEFLALLRRQAFLLAQGM